MKKLKQLVGMVAILSLNLSNAAQAQELEVLFVGNSYTYFNQMPDMVHRIAKVNGIDMKVTSEVSDGVSLKEHWEGEAGLKSKILIENGSYDFIVIQDQSLTPLNAPKKTIEFGGKLAKLIQSKGGVVVIYQTWSRKSAPETQAQLDDTFAILAKETKARIAPVAKAWHRAFIEYPNLELYHNDGSHPSEIGSYLAALMIYKTIFELSDLENVKTFKSTRWPMDEMKQCEWLAHTTESF